MYVFINSTPEAKFEASSASPVNNTKNHLKSPAKSKHDSLEEGEISSEEESLQVRRKKDKKKKKGEARNRVVSLSDNSAAEGASVNGVKDVSLITLYDLV